MSVVEFSILVITSLSTLNFEQVSLPISNLHLCYFKGYLSLYFKFTPVFFQWMFLTSNKSNKQVNKQRNIKYLLKQFLNLISQNLVSFQRFPIHADIEFQNFLLQLKNQRSWKKKVWAVFLYFSFERNYGVNQRAHAFLNQKVIFNNNGIESKSGNHIHGFRQTNLPLHSYKNRELKKRLCRVEAREKKRSFFVTFILRWPAWLI